MSLPTLSATSGKYSMNVLLLLLKTGKIRPLSSMTVEVACTRYVLPDCQLLFFRCSRKKSKPATMLCEPVRRVDRKYVSLPKPSQLSRCSSQPPPQTLQKVGELNRAWPRDRSQMGV